MTLLACTTRDIGFLPWPWISYPLARIERGDEGEGEGGEEGKREREVLQPTGPKPDKEPFSCPRG